MRLEVIKAENGVIIQDLDHIGMDPGKPRTIVVLENNNVVKEAGKVIKELFDERTEASNENS